MLFSYYAQEDFEVQKIGKFEGQKIIHSFLLANYLFSESILAVLAAYWPIFYLPIGSD